MQRKNKRKRLAYKDKPIPKNIIKHILTPKNISEIVVAIILIGIDRFL